MTVFLPMKRRTGLEQNQRWQSASPIGSKLHAHNWLLTPDKKWLNENTISAATVM